MILIILTVLLVALALYLTLDDDLGLGFWVVGGISVIFTTVIIALAIAYDYVRPNPSQRYGRTARELAKGQWYEV
jgi:hypothetical protein